jgi:hypothetical protein
VRLELAFFFDVDTGWVSFGNEFSPDSSSPYLYLSATHDGGSSWSPAVPIIPGILHSYHYVSLNSISFADRTHGWISITVGDSDYPNLTGKILVTEDGGQTWHAAARVPCVLGEAVRISSQEGWMAGGGAFPAIPAELWVTRDGANSWQEVRLAAPEELGSATNETYDVPVFRDPLHGVKMVEFSEENNLRTAVVFVTDDDGRTWKPNRLLHGLMGRRVHWAMRQDVWLTAGVNVDGQLRLTRLGPGADVTIPSRDALTFLPRRHTAVRVRRRVYGWAHAPSSLSLLVTVDAGSHWTAIQVSPDRINRRP